jgi:site-specific DNA-methyltransferase (adenine-specific)
MGRQHPNEKPVALMKYLLNKCLRAPVVDPFMGSGTTLAAAKTLRRRAIGIEIEERYCEIAVRRLAQKELAL